MKLMVSELGEYVPVVLRAKMVSKLGQYVPVTLYAKMYVIVSDLGWMCTCGSVRKNIHACHRPLDIIR